MLIAFRGKLQLVALPAFLYSVVVTFAVFGADLGIASVAAVVEAETLTYTAEIENAPKSDLTVTLSNGQTITIAASPTPHADILAIAKDILAKQGITLDIQEYNDYVVPNTVVDTGEVDANYFQHIPYLNSFNEEQGTHLVNAGGIHYEPFGIYAGTKSDLADIADGDEIAIPNDTTNEARALLLLQDNGILTLKEGAGLTATVNDIESYNVQVKIIELAAESVKDAIPDAAFVVLNGNYALEAGLSVGQDALAYESSDSTAAQTYVNVIAVKEGHENDEGIVALVEVLKSDAITDFINSTYDGAVVPFN